MDRPRLSVLDACVERRRGDARRLVSIYATSRMRRARTRSFLIGFRRRSPIALTSDTAGRCRRSRQPPPLAAGERVDRQAPAHERFVAVLSG